jgi:hypothetical protein
VIGPISAVLATIRGIADLAHDTAAAIVSCDAGPPV